ncbi:MAG: DUF5719 family protein [Nocardioidaceae bacterium]
MILTGRLTAIAAGGAVAVSIAAIALTAAGSGSLDTIDRTPSVVPASTAQLSCPETQSPGTRTDVFALSPAGPAAAPVPGSIAVAPLSAESRTPLATGDQVGVPVTTRMAAAGRSAVAVTATGGLAPGAFAAQHVVRTGSRTSGTAVATCAPSADSWWFTGIDTNVGSTAQLVVSNPSPAVAVVDLVFYGPKGLVKAVGARGIPVAPQSRKSLDLARYAPGLDAVTLEVRATRGRVAAAVGVSRLEGATPGGYEWLAESQPPSDDVLVNPGDSGAGDQHLVLTNTTGRRLLVTAEVLVASGPFTPKGLSEVPIRPGHTVVRDVSAITGGDAAALHVTTDGDITAALVSDSSGAPGDFSASSDSPPLADPAVVPLFDGLEVTLAFATVEDGGGVVEVQAYDAQGAEIGQPGRVPIKSGTTRVWPGPVPPRAAYLVVSVNDGTAVQGQATYHSRQGQSAIPLVSGVWTITRPAVRPGSGD